MTTPSQQLERAVTSAPEIETLAAELQAMMRKFEGQLPQGVVDFLRGQALGHPLHPVLVHLPLGGWIAAGVLDFWPGGSERRAQAADRVLLLATLGAVPTVAVGWMDWTQTRGQVRRTGLVHGLFEESALLLNAASLLARGRGHRRLGKLLSGAGLGLALAGGMLGGELVYGHGVGVK